MTHPDGVAPSVVSSRAVAFGCVLLFVAPARIRPMTIAALYDIHGNLPALEAVLDAVHREGVDQIIVGGDVLPGPMPRESLALLFDLELPVRFLMGNGDRETLSWRDGLESAAIPPAFREVMLWVAAQLSVDDARHIAAWPVAQRADISSLGSVLFCHATPRNDTELFTQITPEARLLPVFATAHADVVVCGHTHMQFDRTVGKTRVVNAGSVGMPFGEPGAYWLLIDDRIHLRHTPYDLEQAAERIRATQYPQAAEFAANNVLRPPAASHMIDAFEKAAVKSG